VERTNLESDLEIMADADVNFAQLCL